MSGSTTGKLFKISTWGESHGKAVGVVIDGCPAGILLTEEDIQNDLNKRKPGTSEFTTSRKESDKIQILSGIFEGKTTGTPISLIVNNTNQHSIDYSEISTCYRPGHADLPYDAKYRFRDYRGGGRSSGRETIGRVAAGAVAKKILRSAGISILTYTKSIGNIEITKFDQTQIDSNNLYMPDIEAYTKASAYIKKLKTEGNSAGGVIECIVKNPPAGLGEPVFDKLDGALAKAIMSIGAVKSFEVGIGKNCTQLTGYENNDFMCYLDDGTFTKQSNNSGGILGGITDGSDIILRASFKPTPSISKSQNTINKNGENTTIKIKGRHDPIIVPRAVIVVESMVAITIADYLMQNMVSNIDSIKKFYT